MKKLFYLRFKSICLIVIYLFLTGSAESNQFNSDKDNFIPAEKPLTESTENKDSLPAGVNEDWLNSLTDDKGNRINPETNITRSRQIPEDPQTDAMQRKVFNSLSAGSQYGFSISDAGDVNSDGYDDIIIGAQAYSSNTGRAYIYFGGLNMNTVADVILTGEGVNDYFGCSVSSTGDVNGDGYDDVIIGANESGSGTGKAYIYFGGSVMNNAADLIFNGQGMFDAFGTSVSSAGDVNGDGYPDVIISASTFGRVYVYFGGASMNNTADVTIIGPINVNFGNSVSSAGDVNGDGYSDVIAGATGLSSAYIYYGGASMNNAADVSMTGAVTFGNSVSDAGDVNGDGYSDVIVGTPNNSPFAGIANIFFGGSSMDNAADVNLSGEPTATQFGLSVSGAGDLNGDGFSDVVVGERYGGTGFSGKTHIFFGGSSMNNITDVSMTGETGFSFFGASVSSAGDVNGDGYPDLIVGAYNYSSFTGRAYLFDYFMKNDVMSDISIPSDELTQQFGWSVSDAGDVNGDGYADVIVGARTYSTSTGRAYIYFGGTVMNTSADVVLTGESTLISFGYSVSGAGDVNGDGYSDVIAGAYQFSSVTGRAYVYFGGAAMDNIADVIMTGDSAGIGLGISVSSAGDVNGDGYSDVIAGAYRYSSFTGRAFVYFGGASMDTTADLTFTGETANSNFGISVSEAGDVNGDGYSDVITGANGYSSGTGRSYIYFGGSSADNTPDVILASDTAGIGLGASVSSAGDFNGDGYSDVISGARSYSSNTGRAYIYYGGLSMNNIADLTMTGEATGSQFGVSVSSAGDFNRDGYNDVIVGAHAYSGITGRSYMYYGGLSADNTADVTMTGETPSNGFGFSVSNAGDVNGDGYNDLISGAYIYSSSAGRAYIYLGSAISANPIINYVRDVPDDQGGKVQLKWSKSSLETYGFNNITDYLVYRSSPPGISGFQWEQIADITAVNFQFYYYTANTLIDSTSNSNGTTYFLIKARNGNTGQMWNSNILYGRSIDNLSPPQVSPFNAAAVGANVNLNWGESSAPDLLNYVLFRSYSPVIDPQTEIPLATSTSLAFLDIAPLSGLYYYFIIAQDIHGNYSPVAVTQSPSVTLNLTMLIQGFYNSGTDMMVQDTARVYLRNSTSPYSVVDSAKAYLGNTGAGTFSFSNAINGVNYYLQLKHRNSLETWSKTPQTFTGNSLTYNFTTANTQAYGDNMIQVDTSPVRFGIYSGDVNQDGVIDASDNGAIDNDATNFETGYLSTDLNGDEVIDASDAAIADNNAANFVSAVTP